MREPDRDARTPHLTHECEQAVRCDGAVIYVLVVTLREEKRKLLLPSKSTLR
jgi:hypothetical protein